MLRFDPDDERLLDYQVVQVHTDASVQVGPRVAWPRATPVTAPTPTPDAAVQADPAVPAS